MSVPRHKDAPLMVPQEELIARWLDLGVHRQQPCTCADCHLMRGLAELVRMGCPLVSDHEPAKYAPTLTVDL